MTECDIDGKIKNYWACKEKLIPEDILHKMEELCKEFQDATEDNPVNAAEFLGYLDLECLSDFFSGLYGREPTYPALAMLGGLFMMDLKKMKFFTELVRELKEDTKLAESLGFPKKDNRVLVPSSKNFWHFYNIRVGQKWDELFNLLRDRVVIEANSIGLHIGEKTVEDAMPVKSLAGDEEAKYNDHYKVKGYKLDTITDLTTGVPLSKKTTCINDDEARNLVPQLEALLSTDIKVKNHWIDGGYDDYPNLAWMGVNGIMTHHQIHENWVYNEKGNAEHLMVLYQKYWKDADFKPKADPQYVLKFLLKKGYEEEVGAYFRNQAMDTYAENPLAYLKDYHQRSRQEGNHGYWKEHLEVEVRLRVKGLVKVDRYLTRNLCSLLAVVLCRLQHGVKNKLTSVVYLT